jgi:dUTP pyrophosphatase
MADLRVAIERLPHGAGLPLPAYATAGAAGLDLLAAVPEAEPLALEPGRHALVPTGVRIALPPGYEAQVRPRSGLALRHGVTVLNSPGTIDADYRGEIGVILINLGRVSFPITRAMRVAQLVVAPVAKVSWDVGSLERHVTGRGQGGFGSTGVEPAAAQDHER